jgi:hypothetical protein
MTEIEYQARMQALLEDIGPRLDLNGADMDSYDVQVEQHDAQLDLDEDDSEENYDPRAHR